MSKGIMAKTIKCLWLPFYMYLGYKEKRDIKCISAKLQSHICRPLGAVFLKCQNPSTEFAFWRWRPFPSVGQVSIVPHHSQRRLRTCCAWATWYWVIAAAGNTTYSLVMKVEPGWLQVYMGTYAFSSWRMKTVSRIAHQLQSYSSPCNRTY